MIRRLTFFVLFLVFLIRSQTSIGQTTIYCLPGQGADRRQFQEIEFPDNYRVVYLEYGTPEKHMGMRDFAETLVSQIDTSETFVLLGVSLGGMLCVELNEFVHPEKTILISSAKNATELPKKYSFQRNFPIYKAVPKALVKGGARILQPIVERDQKMKRDLCEDMLKRKSRTYMKRTVEMIVNWERSETQFPIYQIHGTEDHTLPLKHIVNPQLIIENGSHLMVLTMSLEITAALKTLL